MEATAARQTREKIVNPGMASAASAASMPSRAMGTTETRGAGFGLPCAKCRAYYPSDMPACPICRTRERVSPTSGGKAAVAAPAPAQSNTAKLLAEERERLRQLKSQIYASHPQMPSTQYRCALDQNHNGTAEPAAVCHSCYGTARQQADRMEAALHMDVKEAAKIVYDAVWADASDPNKTYLNAAVALLSELRRRAGVGLLLGPNQPFSH